MIAHTGTPALYLGFSLLDVVGAILMRAVLIYLGVVLIERFDWIFYLFGAFLLLTGVKMLFFGGEKPDLGANPLPWQRRPAPG